MTDYPHGDTPPRSVLREPNAVRDLKQMAQDDDVLYEAVVVPERTRRFAECLDALMRKRSVSALRLYRDIAQKIGRRFEVDQEVVHRLGAPVDRARFAVRALEHVEGLDDAGTAEMVLGWLRDYYRPQGKEVCVVSVAEAEVESADPVSESELP